MKFTEFYSVWFRRPRMIALNSHQADSDGVEFARDEWRALLEATYALAKDLL